MGFVDEPDIAHEVQLQRRECPRLRVCPPSPDSFPHAAQSARLRSLQLEARTCLGDEPFDRRLRADVLSRRRRLRAGQCAPVPHREEGAALDRGSQVGRRILSSAAGDGGNKQLVDDPQRRLGDRLGQVARQAVKTRSKAEASKEHFDLGFGGR